MALWMEDILRECCDVLYGHNGWIGIKKVYSRSNKLIPIFFFWPELKDLKFFPGGSKTSRNFSGEVP
jgi:hypothetical protein